jgi:hypothetical protein
LHLVNQKSHRLMSIHPRMQGILLAIEDAVALSMANTYPQLLLLASRPSVLRHNVLQNSELRPGGHGLLAGCICRLMYTASHWQKTLFTNTFILQLSSRPAPTIRWWLT